MKYMLLIHGTRTVRERDGSPVEVRRVMEQPGNETPVASMATGISLRGKFSRPSSELRAGEWMPGPSGTHTTV